MENYAISLLVLLRGRKVTITVIYIINTSMCELFWDMVVLSKLGKQILTKEYIGLCNVILMYLLMYVFDGRTIRCYFDVQAILK